MKREALQMLTFNSQDAEKAECVVESLAKTIRKKLGRQRCGRPRANLCFVICGIIFYARYNCGWEHIPSIFGKGKTLYGWFRRLVKIGFFLSVWMEILRLLQQTGRVNFKRLKVDGSLVQASGGGALAVSTPRNHNKRSLNRGVAVEGNGVPIALKIVPGSTHDSQFFAPLFASAVVNTELQPGFYLHADKGFDALWIRMIISNAGGHAQIPVRNHGFTIPYRQGKDSFRWQIEQSHSWTNRFRALKNIFSSRPDCIYELHHLVFALICSRKLRCCDLKRAAARGFSEF